MLYITNTFFRFCIYLLLGKANNNPTKIAQIGISIFIATAYKVYGFLLISSVWFINFYINYVSSG